MPEAEQATAQYPPAGESGGTLILVVGPSGAGKDTLLDAARARFRDNPDIVFWRRFITRQDQTGETHAAVSEAEFTRMAEDGGFFLFWEAHRLNYGVTSEVLESLMAGRSVVVNVSRRIVAEARAKWPATRVIHVTARPEILQARLEARGRETADGIGSRLERGRGQLMPQAEWVYELDNSNNLEASVSAFTALIARLAAAPS